MCYSYSIKVHRGVILKQSYTPTPFLQKVVELHQPDMSTLQNIKSISF